MQIVTVKSGSLDRKWIAQMKSRDRMKLSHRVTPAVRSSLDVCDVSACPSSPSDALNLNRYNSFDKRLRFNFFEIRIVIKLESDAYPFT